MAFAEYAYRIYGNNGLIRENESGSQWAFRLSSKVSPPTSTNLEEEIYDLRIRMEQLFNSCQSLTAPDVVEASTELDNKLNEYMVGYKSRNR